ncbi:sensor histidine kinase [Paenibacillus hamazuiensis]|uniref:sensor histidine kinase n=1 Tax=Paenibacillus hamazuiensis TaxID=2936508 RepID=UPI00200DFCEF|nr:histidine kinase [Paenibacillus hamazuiensis]
MTLWIRWWQRLTIYPKLVMSFLVIILPVLGVSLSMNAMGAESVRSEITHSMSASAKQYLNLIAMDLNRAIRRQREYINSPDLMDLAFKSPVMTEVDKTAAIVRLQQQLRQFKSENAFIEDIVVYIPAISRTLSANDGSVQAIVQEQYEAMKEAARLMDSPLIPWRDKQYISFSYPDGIALIGSKEPLFVFAIELSKANLQQTLSQFRFGRSGGAVLASTKNGWIVSSEADETVGPRLASSVAQDPHGSGASVTPSLQLNGRPYVVAMDREPTLGIALIAYVEEAELLGPLKKYRIWFWLLCALSMLAVAVFSYWIHKWIHQPIKKLVSAFRSVEKGNLEVTVARQSEDEFGYLFVQFNGMVAEIKRLIQEVYEKNYRLQVSEYRQLQSQINPHFLYNSFFIIYRMAKLQETDSVMKLTQYLGEYFRFITRSGADEVPLKEELTHAGNYVAIQSIRFNNRIEAVFEDIPQLTEKLVVPRLIVQPIIENVYQHAFRNKLADGIVHIGYEPAVGEFRIVVEDNGPGVADETVRELSGRLFAAEREIETTGMINVHRRLKIKYGEAGGLRLARSELGGLKVTMTIPLQGGEPHAQSDRH